MRLVTWSRVFHDPLLVCGRKRNRKFKCQGGLGAVFLQVPTCSLLVSFFGENGNRIVSG